MSDSRKEFEAAALATWGDQYALHPAYVKEDMFSAWELGRALSVAPAPVAAQPVAWRYRFSPDHSWRYVEYELQKSGMEEQPLFAAPPVQEGPKGVGLHLYRSKPCWSKTWTPWSECDEEHAKYHKENPIQNGWDYEVRTFNAATSSPAQSIPAAIDEEGRRMPEGEIEIRITGTDNLDLMRAIDRVLEIGGGERVAGGCGPGMQIYSIYQSALLNPKFRNPAGN